VPAPPQVSGAEQVPQLIVPPHPSSTVPQLSPAGHAVAGVQTHWLLAQVDPAAQVPQSIVPPQPSEIVPQLVTAGHAVSGVQHASR
jgi:hypothetical protein